ncbi:MAG: sulfite exporter TauE/SafE family protein [Clostridia bacterium]|nr:sulfite exporter TauE/SafE family protein [Clostridia bacterium]
MPKLLLFYLVIFLSNIIQCITGFAGTVLAMPFSLMLVGYATAKPILNVLGIAASIGVLLNNYRYVDKSEFFKIVVVMSIGIGGGMFISPHITANPDWIEKILGAVVIFFAAYNAFIFFKKKNKEPNKVLSFLLLAGAGLIHGLFVCGGPLLVTYASSKIKDTRKFRATISAVWVVLNSIILFVDIKDGYFTPRIIPNLTVCMVLLFLALIVGEKLAKKLSKNAFMILSYVLMFDSGISLLVDFS